jgi:hypothetical protein
MANMKVFILLVLAACAFGFETEDDVIVGTDSNFDEIISAHQYVLVEFCKSPLVTWLYLLTSA